MDNTTKTEAVLAEDKMAIYLLATFGGFIQDCIRERGYMTFPSLQDASKVYLQMNSKLVPASIRSEHPSQLIDKGVQLINEKRSKHVQKGWTAQHDAQHNRGELAKVAAILSVVHTDATVVSPDGWESGKNIWGLEDNPDIIDRLAIAGSLIAAEIMNQINLRKNSYKDPVQDLHDLSEAAKAFHKRNTEQPKVNLENAKDSLEAESKLNSWEDVEINHAVAEVCERFLNTINQNGESSWSQFLRIAKEVIYAYLSDQRTESTQPKINSEEFSSEIKITREAFEKSPFMIPAFDRRVLVNGEPFPVDFRCIAEKRYQALLNLAFPQPKSPTAPQPLEEVYRWVKASERNPPIGHYYFCRVDTKQEDVVETIVEWAVHHNGKFPYMDWDLKNVQHFGDFGEEASVIEWLEKVPTHQPESEEQLYRVKNN